MCLSYIFIKNLLILLLKMGICESSTNSKLNLKILRKQKDHSKN